MRGQRGQVLGLLIMVASALSAGEPGQPPAPAVADVVAAVCASLARYHSISCRMVTAVWSRNPPPVGVRSRPADGTEIIVRRAWLECGYGNDGTGMASAFRPQAPRGRHSSAQGTAKRRPG